MLGEEQATEPASAVAVRDGHTLPPPSDLINRQSLSPAAGSMSGGGPEMWLLTGAVLTATVAPDLLAGDVPFVARLAFAVTVSVASAWAIPGLLPWMRRVRMHALSMWQHQRQLPPGAVRIVGTVLAREQPFPAIGTARAAVYEQTRFLNITRFGTVVSEAYEEIRGVPFRVETDACAQVNVEPGEVRLIDPSLPVLTLPAELCQTTGVDTGGKPGRKYQQAVLQPGDRVELVGQLERQVAPTGRGAPGRGIPMEISVRPVWKGGVWIRPLPPLTPFPPLTPRE